MRPYLLLITTRNDDDARLAVSDGAVDDCALAILASPFQRVFALPLMSLVNGAKLARNRATTLLLRAVNEGNGCPMALVGDGGDEGDEGDHGGFMMACQVG